MINVLMDFYEKGLNGQFVKNPHRYRFNLGANQDNLSKIHDIICQAVEIEAFNPGDYLLVITCQENGIIFGKTNFILHIADVEYVDVPSRYTTSNKSINLDTFRYILQFLANSPYDTVDESKTAIFES